ncbi:4'-phosphopantetheinyl transferase superfamily protein [Luteococcus sp. H138]|uniref:4'-phosphopantetheinyl transferase family protein n=1 Tax=unclassified Luteococcus TaxID=2639923 RepID=UPI00313C69B5
MSRPIRLDAVPVWLSSGPADDAHALLLALAARVLELLPEEARRLRLGHACPQCGSGDHGRPVLLGCPVLVGSGPVHVSLGRDRSGELAVVALCRDAPVGVDVEAAGAADFGGFDELVLHPDERATGPWTPVARTAVWVRKEAVLKARGTGLATDPRTITLADLPDVAWRDVDLGPAWQCTVAVSRGVGAGFLSGARGGRAASAG